MPTSIERTLLQAGLQNPAASTLGFADISIARSTIPVILAPNGTVATNGTVTLVTALPLIYTAAWVRLPAGAVVGGLAGLYYTVFSSTTVGQVYTNYIDGTGLPSIPTATLVAAVGSNSAYTQATTAVTLASATVPANAMGDFGAVELATLTSTNSTAGAKTVSGRFGGSVFMTGAVTTSTALETRKKVRNRGIANTQIVHPDFTIGAASSVVVTQLAVNTAAAVTVAVTGTIAVATDVFVLEAFTLKLEAA
jgi:hypothetical protein